MTQTVLIANRGEIARRVMRTAKDMGFRTVAVYSDADRSAPHVRDADKAVHIGPSPAADSYLVIGNIIKAAKQTGATMIHPGYGFLSENTEFAQACADNEIIFVGAPAAAINAMGLKDAAKDLMDKAGVPIVPGYNGEDQSAERLKAAADEIGYPVMIKAVAGGGGKGMRIVADATSFADQLTACTGEANRAFGNDKVLIEKFINAPRHVEVQVFSDTHGNHVHLFDRDCSIQRRHQKIIEEAPAPGIPDEVRAKMYDAAVQAARAVDYVGAGTIEFIMDAETFDFYFMEMNTRLQVEHPVTEEITGIDLVEWQLRVAMGEALPLGQNDITKSGHAIEVRLYAEDPDNGFLPSTGQLTQLQFGHADNRTRIECGAEKGDYISPFYDPMIAKIIVQSESRADAVRDAGYALRSTHIEGVRTNRAQLNRIVGSDAFASADLRTSFLNDHRAVLAAAMNPPENISRAAAIAAIVPALIAEADETAWQACGPWRLNGPVPRRIVLQSPGQEELVFAVFQDAYGSVVVDGQRHEVYYHPAYDHSLEPFVMDQELYYPVVSNTHIEIRYDSQTYVFARPDGLHGKNAAHAGQGAVTAPMPGNVLSIAVSKRETVEAGQSLMVLEAMKMEHRIVAPKAGLVKVLHVSAGAQVKDGDILIEIGEEE
ncbi:MAG: biotin carboxylase N-terminal domain-containing protein [Pseudomonadota bacterium]